jgi:phage protein D
MTIEFPETLAPNFSLKVNNNRVGENIRELITEIEYESSDGMADMMRIMVADVLDEGGRMRVRDSKLFMPGNVVAVFLGYGTQLRHVGTAVIRRVRPTFPSTGYPTVEVIAYTADSLMADSAPEPLKEVKQLKRKKGVRIKNSRAGRRWTDAKYSEAVIDRANAYGFELDVDTTPDAPSEFIQRANMSDYDFVSGMANLVNFVFWVDGSHDGIWTLHFKDPQKLKRAGLQEKVYTFKYGDEDYSTLLNFEPEFAIQGAITKVMVQTKDPITGRVLEAAVEEENDDATDTQVEPGNVRSEADMNGAVGQTRGKGQLDARNSLDVVGNGLEGPLLTASDVKIFIDDFSFDIRSNRRFRNEADLAQWAAQWFQKNRENFMLGRGSLIGVESLRARQQHIFAGLGTTYDGTYYFTRVRHVLNENSGYMIDFSSRRIVPELPPVTSQADVQITDLLVTKINEYEKQRAKKNAKKAVTFNEKDRKRAKEQWDVMNAERERAGLPRWGEFPR